MILQLKGIVLILQLTILRFPNPPPPRHAVLEVEALRISTQSERKDGKVVSPTHPQPLPRRRYS